jgi:hypothetical protein
LVLARYEGAPAPNHVGDLDAIGSVLARAVAPLQRPATAHERAKMNGRGPTQADP